ncbi:uncharacterized protein LOC107765527 [Nicotiana tabacum]|uniref:Transcription factor PAR1 n=2 Tax=Nicotiana TaxID=4085 RepID=A0A1S3XJ18_TOBAC|nr:PREDICTED: transcription factor PAR1 [Nicotiana sylvestris]XP_016439672.1 PREDICTED: transcription factor PAR1-like [Nicotiana tabacum]
MESSCNSEETTTTVATLSRKDQKMTQKNSKRQKRMRNNVKKVLKESSSNCNTDNAGNNQEEDDDKAEVEEKIMALQKIVPGGESLGVDMLFEETAGYILALQCQIKTLKVLASFVEGSEKERMKLGG